MYKLFITHTPMGICYLVATDIQGKIVYKVCISQTTFFDLRERNVPEIANDVNEIKCSYN